MAKRRKAKAGTPGPVSPTATVEACSASLHGPHPDGIDRCAYCYRPVTEHRAP